MNPLFKEAAQYAELGWLMGVTTALFLACFIGWTWWAFSHRNRERMAAAAWLPLSEDEL
jgi:cbb3-type cytochrome oxidase subunit 3